MPAESPVLGHAVAECSGDVRVLSREVTGEDPLRRTMAWPRCKCQGAVGSEGATKVTGDGRRGSLIRGRRVCRDSGLLERGDPADPACGGPLNLVVRVRHEVVDVAVPRPRRG